MLNRRVLAAWLALCLVMGQGLVLMHRLAHAHGSGAPVAVKLDGAGNATDWTARLFGHHDSDSACHLFDGQASTGAPAPVVTLPAAAPATFFIAFAQGDALARRAALFDARGPPTPAC